MKTLKITVVIIAAGLLPSKITLAQNNAIAASINVVVKNYLAVKTALAANDGAAAENKAAALLVSLNSVPTGFSSNKATLISKMQYDSRHISEVNRIGHQREHFVSLSDNLYLLLKDLKVNTMTVYREYCTMNKSHYLTDNEKAADPYMGMTNCSRTVETLQAVK